MEIARKSHPETAAAVSHKREAKPILFHLGETIPVMQLTIANMPGSSSIPQEDEILNDLPVKFLVLIPLTVKEKERVDENGLPPEKWSSLK